MPDAGFVAFLKIGAIILKKPYKAYSFNWHVYKTHFTSTVVSHLYFRALTGICKRLPPSNGRWTVSSSAWSIRSASFRAHREITSPRRFQLNFHVTSQHIKTKVFFNFLSKDVYLKVLFVIVYARLRNRCKN